MDRMAVRLSRLWRWRLLSVWLLAVPALAGPAPWYVWRSKLDGKELCAQASPGPGWVQQGGPFIDADCRRLPPRLLPM